MGKGRKSTFHLYFNRSKEEHTIWRSTSCSENTACERKEIWSTWVGKARGTQMGSKPWTKRPQSNIEHKTLVHLWSCMQAYTYGITFLVGPHQCEHFLIFLLRFSQKRVITYLTVTLVLRSILSVFHFWVCIYHPVNEYLDYEYQCCGDHTYVLHAHLKFMSWEVFHKNWTHVLWDFIV